MKRRLIASIVVVLALAAAGYYYRASLLAWGQGIYAGQIAPRLGGKQPAVVPGADSELVASGTIEAETIAISSPNAGRLVAVRVAEGDLVAAGDLVAEMDATLVDAQLEKARAAVSQAKAQVALLEAGARPADADVARAAFKQAEAARDAASTAWQDAKALVDAPSTLDVRIANAQTIVRVTEQQLKAAQANATAADLEQALWGRTVKLLQEGLDVTLPYPGNPTVHVDARADRVNSALLQWNLASQKTWQAHAQANIVSAGLDSARQNLSDLTAQRADPAALQVQANAAESAYRQAEAGVATAQANLDVVLAGSPAEQIEAAQALVRQAEAGVQALQARREQARVLAPQAGTVTTVVRRTGEVAGAGGPIVRLADLRRLTLTVYVPEPQLGRVRLGQAVGVRVDSFPGRTFAGSVSQVADQAEFTPKNVQTREERVNTVYAVKIALGNAGGELKAGMPADAYFDGDGSAQNQAVSLGAGADPGAETTPSGSQAAAAPIEASGTIEGSEYAVSAEIGGRVVEVAAAEGDSVPVGKVLVRVDATELEAQYNEALAGAAAARADLARVEAPPQEARVNQAKAQVKAAQTALGGATTALDDARRLRANPQDLDAQINSAKTQLAAAMAQVDLARANLKAAQVLQDSLQPGSGSDLDKTRRALYDQQVIAAQAGVDGAELQQAGAQSALNKLWAMRNHPVALDAAVHRAQGQVLQASAGITLAITSLAQVQARVQPEAITLGQAKVTQAEASAALVKATIDKLSIRAPISGTVTAQVVHPGEVAQPGQTLLTLVDLSQVKLAVFVPAGQIGRVRLGQGAVVTVDAYPARAFSGVVSHINDQAEFTPKNVQTPEERARTVFRVEIALENPGGALKPGMPADAVLQ